MGRPSDVLDRVPEVYLERLGTSREFNREQHCDDTLRAATTFSVGGSRRRQAGLGVIGGEGQER